MKLFGDVLCIDVVLVSSSVVLVGWLIGILV